MQEWHSAGPSMGPELAGGRRADLLQMSHGGEWLENVILGPEEEYSVKTHCDTFLLTANLALICGLGFYFFLFFFFPPCLFPWIRKLSHSPSVLRSPHCSRQAALGNLTDVTWASTPTSVHVAITSSTVQHAVSALLCSELHGALCHWQHLSALIKHLETSANPSAAGEGWAPSAACSACSLPAFFLHHSYAAPTVKCLWVTAKASVLSSHADCFITLRSRKALTFG